jgi:hypothetical protein
VKLSTWRNTYWVRGAVVDKTSGQGIQGLTIEAWDKDITSADDRLGSTTTLQQGRFSIHFDSLQFADPGDRKPDVYFKVFSGTTLLLNTEADVKWNVGRRYERVRLEVNAHQQRSSYRVHPAIGIARVGDSETGSYLGQEVPKIDFEPPESHYRDAAGAIKRMGCRFRVYEYDGETPVREVTAGIRWTVDLVNAKPTAIDDQSSVDFLIDPGPKSIGGLNQHVAVEGPIQGHHVKLGDLRTDESGRLVVYGGHGKSASWNNSPVDSLFNAGWYDDVADGSVRATITLPGGTQVEAEPAWVITSVPDYAHSIQSIVSLYDLAEDLSDPNARNGEVSFLRHVYPVLQRTVYTRFASGRASFGHRAGSPGDFLAPELFTRLHSKTVAGAAEARLAVFSRVRDPGTGGSDADGENMPELNSLSVTPTQYARLKRWSDGEYVDDWPASANPQTPSSIPSLDSLPIAQQPAALDQAGLDFCVGGSFHPGIEAGDIMARPSTYATPHRIDVLTVEPGELTKQLSVPWQADFLACGEGWWPGGRPSKVASVTRPAGYSWSEGIETPSGMVTEWAKLGFLARDRGSEFNIVETERLIPPQQ